VVVTDADGRLAMAGIVGAPEFGATTRSFLLLVAGAVAIGFAPICSVDLHGACRDGFLENGTAVPVLMLARRQEISAGDLRFRSACRGGVCLDLTAWHFSIRLTSVANATLLANCAVLLVPLLSWLVCGALRLGTIGALGWLLRNVLLSSPSLETAESNYGAMRLP
jgi:hypothetical protein